MKLTRTLRYATGPTPPTPEDARMLGWEERELLRRLDGERDAFRFYGHVASVPELVRIVREVGRDCTYEPFASRQALLRVSAAPNESEEQKP